MVEIARMYAEEISNTSEAGKIQRQWELGLITFSDAVQQLIEAAKNNAFYYVIQYRKSKSGKYCDYCETLYEYGEAMAEIDRLREAAPAFTWRTRKEVKQ